MADTNFIHRQTVITADWLNDVNDHVYNSPIHLRIFGSDAAALQDAIDEHEVVDLSGGTYTFSSTINIPSNRTILMYGATITANVGSSPLFLVDNADEGINIFGGTVVGTMGSYLKLQGSTTTPTVSSQYSRQIRLRDTHVSSTTATLALDLDDAARQIFIDSCFFYTVNGIRSEGKGVEFFANKSVWYSSTGAASTYGVKLSSPAGTTYFNEGFHFTDCLIDNFDTAFDVDDLFVLTVTGGYVDGLTYAFDFGAPTSTANHHISLSNFTCGQKIRFVPSGGYAYHANLHSLIFTGITGVNIQLANNAASIDISSCKFDTSTSGVAIECVNNNANISISDITCDSTFIGGVQFKGANGANCSLRGVSYAGTGDSVYTERPVYIQGVPITSTNVAAYNRKFNSSDLTGSVTVGNTIASITVDCAKGETGHIHVALPVTGGTTATQRFQITAPTGMVLPSGTGWSSVHIFTSNEDLYVSDIIPYYTTQDIVGGTLAITNAAGSTVTINSHGRFGIVKDW